MGIIITKLSSGLFEVTGVTSPYSLLPNMHLFRDKSGIDGIRLVASVGTVQDSFRASDIDKLVLSDASEILNPTGDELYEAFRDDLLNTVTLLVARQFDGVNDNINLDAASDLSGKVITVQFTVPSAAVNQIVWANTSDTTHRTAIGCSLGVIGGTVNGGAGNLFTTDTYANLGISEGDLVTVEMAISDYITAPVVKVNNTTVVGATGIGLAAAAVSHKLGSRTSNSLWYGGEVVFLTIGATVYDESTNWNSGTINGAILVESTDGGATWVPV